MFCGAKYEEIGRNIVENARKRGDLARIQREMETVAWILLVRRELGLRGVFGTGRQVEACRAGIMDEIEKIHKLGRMRAESA